VRIDPDVLIPSLIAAGLILLISFPVHEAAHAYTAWRLGDGTARMFGRITLNPIVHFDPVGGLLLIASSILGVGIGWAKPTPVNPSNLRGGSEGEAIVAFAGPASNLVLAALGAIPLRLLLSARETGTDVPDVVTFVFFYFVLINVALFIFNLIPVPPLDGSKVLFSFMSPRQAYRWRPVLEQYGLVFFLLIVFLPLLPGQQTVFEFLFDKIGLPIVSFLVGRSLVG
jgi:Zn-dependent protease